MNKKINQNQNENQNKSQNENQFQNQFQNQIENQIENQNQNQNQNQNKNKNKNQKKNQNQKPSQNQIKDLARFEIYVRKRLQMKIKRRNTFLILLTLIFLINIYCLWFIKAKCSKHWILCPFHLIIFASFSSILIYLILTGKLKRKIKSGQIYIHRINQVLRNLNIFYIEKRGKLARLPRRD
ncbi:nuclear envelope phosphatase-regulatory subunit 1 [Anaeramoeba ignava]|uniref:Nuclear envelope phosphatase-regulatory subunit 1 n=1 Tax=Anaeramoeba ignava TaxID=1746090 RepID=A0A9Q0LQ22_ANAIG|nr:nuclear envelope phosphatase-regulatory subunit 1 [Anaeramoeba ignava]